MQPYTLYLILLRIPRIIELQIVSLYLNTNEYCYVRLIENDFRRILVSSLFDNS